jgi:dipeptidyl-peptidase-4
MQQALKEIFSLQGGGRAGGRAGRLGGPRWTDGGKGYLAIERGEIVRYDTATGQRQVLISQEQLTSSQTGRPLVPANYEWSSDGGKLLVFTNPHRELIRKQAGEYWLLDRKTSALRKIGGGHSDLMFAKLSPDGSRVVYLRGQNIYVENLADGSIRQLTSDGSDMILNGVSDWVYDEEFGLSDAWRWSPDSQKIAYWQFDQSKVPVYTLINYTDTLYPILFQYPYPKAGQTNAAVRVGVVSVNGGPTHWAQSPGDPRNIYISRMEWAGNSDEIIYELLNRLQNTNDVMVANASTGAVRRMFREEDKAWVEDVTALRWIDRGRRLLWTSERDGWRHAYSAGRDGDLRLLTNFPGDVISIAEADEASGWLYFIASPDSPTERFLYRSRLDGSGKPERVTPAVIHGFNSYSISTDGQYAFHTQSRIDQPPMSELVKLPSHTTVRVIDDAAAARQRAKDQLGGRIEFVNLDIGNGVKIDGWLMRPHNFDATKKYPIIVYVYGEPAGANAVDNYSGVREQFHAALSDEGYLIATFDNSGTPSPKGREWRKVIYGSVGVLASQEQAAALRKLASQHSYIDLDRVGVWGWSGGGSMTDNLMFRSPDLYKVGVAVAAVPDQTLYDSIYQERYMGLPQQNPKGYYDGSPINFAEGLRGKLLIVHGTGDDNVHFQGDQRLINRLVELGKSFDFMEYPNRTHGISEGAGTSLHVYSLIARYFEEHLAPGGR